MSIEIDREVLVVVVGDSGTGKTSTFLPGLSQAFDFASISTGDYTKMLLGMLHSQEIPTKDYKDDAQGNCSHVIEALVGRRDFYLNQYEEFKKGEGNTALTISMMSALRFVKDNFHPALVINEYIWFSGKKGLVTSTVSPHEFDQLLEEWRDYNPEGFVVGVYLDCENPVGRNHVNRRMTDLEYLIDACNHSVLVKYKIEEATDALRETIDLVSDVLQIRQKRSNA
jgi:hypothetical protein